MNNLDGIIEGGVWATRPVKEQPHLGLRNWAIYECDSDEWPGTTLHFVGYSDENREGRVSSEIVKLDKEAKKGVTKSGRVYQLFGEPGSTLGGDYTFERWKGINGITKAVNVSEKLIK